MPWARTTRAAECVRALAKNWQSSLYRGWVMHRRLSPRVHQFKYSVFAMLIDLDELPVLDQTLKLFSWNRRGIVSFQDRDHGDGKDLRVWLNRKLSEAGITADGKISVLCYPRLFGYVFNPISVWFCHRADGALAAIIYEVHNTYDERHAYVLAVNDNAALVRQRCAKDFYVSPFLSMDCTYDFRIRPPGEEVAIAIHEEEAGQPILNASFYGRRKDLSDWSLLGGLLRYPLMTLKVFVGIHFEAVRLMLKGIRRHDHSPAREPV